MKNQLACLALGGALVGGEFVSVGQATETNAATLSVGLVRGIPGSTVRVPLALSHTGGVSAVQFDLNYPAAKLTAGSFQSGLFSNNVVVRSRQIAPGQHRILLYDHQLAALSTNAGLGGLSFSVPAGDLAGGGQVRITNALASTTIAGSVQPLRLSHGAVLVGPVVRDDDGIVDLFLTVQSNRTYVIQATTNFTNWVNLSTNFAVQDYIVFKDEAAVAYTMRFYRAVPAGTGGGGLIESLQVMAGGFMTLSYPAVAGRAYVLQTTTNLGSWQNLQTNVAAAVAIGFTNQMDAAYPARFFRIQELP